MLCYRWSHRATPGEIDGIRERRPTVVAMTTDDTRRPSTPEWNAFRNFCVANRRLGPTVNHAIPRWFSRPTTSWTDDDARLFHTFVGEYGWAWDGLPPVPMSWA